jgi:hypothetical protein
MPISPVSYITRAATIEDNEALNILTFVTHERYEPNLCKTGHNFYAYTGEGIRDWNTNYAPIPENYSVLDKSMGGKQLPIHLDIDLIISQNILAHYGIAEGISNYLNVPIVNIHHTLPPPQWGQEQLQALSTKTGVVDVYITDYNKRVWGINPDSSKVIYHGIDSDFWKPTENVKRGSYALSVVNDWINRDWCCGYNVWKEVTTGIPTKAIGDTPGLSQPAESLEDLRNNYSSCGMFVNTSTYSPIPMSLLEAMSCGCAVVSTATCAIPEIIENGVNGFATNDLAEMKEYIAAVMSDDNLRDSLGKEARRTMLERFSIKRFADEWNDIFYDIVNNA